MQANGLISEQVTQRRILRVQWWSRCAITVFALILFWICRFRMNVDGVCYLDMGDLYWKGDWHAALSAYWSPLYGWLTGLMFLATRPGLHWEYVEIKLLNFAIFMAALFCFEFFWREVLATKGAQAWAGTARPFAWIIGYVLFAQVHLVIHPSDIATPDLFVAAVMYLAFAMILRFSAGRMGAVSALCLGVLLGAGYLAKAAMLPFAALIMMTMLACAWKQRGRKSLIAATMLGFLVICLPFIAALSWNMHRLTFGDSGRLNYAWNVNKESLLPSYLNEPVNAASRRLERTVIDSQEVDVLNTPLPGTYPVSYNPVYWAAGLDSRMHPARQVQALYTNIGQIAMGAFLRSGLLATLVLLFFINDRVANWWRNFQALWLILVPAVAVFIMYAMVVWEPRYTSGVLLVVWGAVIAATSISQATHNSNKLLVTSLLFGAMFVCMFSIARIHNYSERDLWAYQVPLAERLRTLGIIPGDRVAVIGDVYDASTWARLDKVSIAAVVHNNNFASDAQDNAFWHSSPECEAKVLDILRSNGTKAVIAVNQSAVLPPGWISIGNTGHAIYFFR